MELDHSAGDRGGLQGRGRRKVVVVVVVAAAAAAADDVATERRAAAAAAAGQEPQEVVADGQVGQETQEERVRAVAHPRRRAAGRGLLQVQTAQLVEHLRARSLAPVNNNS